MKKYNLTLVNIYSAENTAEYLFSSYVLKAYIDKYIPGNALSITILNFSGSNEISGICEQIMGGSPDWVGYSCYIWNIEKILEIAKNIKASAPPPVQIFGGPEISINRISSLPDPSAADYYVLGEGEKKLCSLLTYLIENSPGSVVPKGIAYIRNNKVEYSVDTSTITRLDDIPSVYLNNVIDDNLYSAGQAFLETQRGCVFKCKYCVYHKNLSRISYYSLERIFAELEHLVLKKRILMLRIFDAVFTSNIGRAKNIAQHLLKLKNQKGIRMPWIFWELTPINFDEEFAEMTAALKNRENINNCNEMPVVDKPQHYSDMQRGYNVISGVGIQSFCKESLKAVGRVNIQKERLARFMGLMKKHNLVMKLDLILGLPFETFDSYFEGLEYFLPFLKDTDHVLNIHRLQILPGSDLEDSCAKYSIDYSLTAPHTVFSTPTFSEKELNEASKLTAVLLRVLNSPLRKYLFAVKERTGNSFLKITKTVLDGIYATDNYRNITLVKEDQVDDIYWNDKIFFEIPSEWLIGRLEDIR